MKKILLICCLCILLGTVWGNSNNEKIYIAPDYIASFYDQYTVNMLNTRSLGMGSSTVALRGGIESSLINPASFKGGKVTVYVEGHVKGETEEMNRFMSQENGEIIEERQMLQSDLPAVVVGLGYAPDNFLSLGTSFSMPQNIRYRVFGRLLKTGAYVDRFPTMRNYQGTITLNTHFEGLDIGLDDLNVGLNLIVNHYTFRDLRIENSFDRVRFNETVFRLQPGILYEQKHWSIGASYKLPAKHKFEVGNIPHSLYYSNRITLPGLLEAGFSVRQNDYIYTGAVEYEQTSSQYHGFDDRFKFKAGIEKALPNFTLRGGAIYISDIYTGKHQTLRTEVPHEDLYPLDYDYLKVEETEQLIITGGFTYPLPMADFSLAAATDVMGKLDLFQLSVSFSIRIEEILKETKIKRNAY